MTDSDYNLLNEPWIPVQFLDGTVADIGIREIFSQASQIDDLACDLPTVGFAIKRLLLAICYRTLDVPDTEAWEDLWHSGIPEEPIAEYLDRWEARFFLFDERYPFMQAPGLSTPSGAISGLEKIVADIPKGKPFFTIRQQCSIDRISPAEAARWLIHAQAFDSPGIRSGAVGDPKMDKGKGYPIGASWAGQLGGVWLKGANFAESLVLNIIPRAQTDTRGPASTGPLGACTWESDEIETAIRRNYAMKSKKNEDGNPDPNGYAISRLLTWHSRRIRLFGDRQGVTGVILAQGDKLGPQNMQDYEPMSLWYYSARQSKEFKTTVYMPRKHELGRAFWRALPGTLPFGEKTTSVDGLKLASFRPSATLSFHRDPGYFVSSDYPVRIRIEAVGMSYGDSDKDIIEDIYQDEVDLATILLQESRKEFPELVNRAVIAVEGVASRIGIFAANLARASGEAGEGAGEGARDRAKARFFALVDSPFRQWLSGIHAESDVSAEGEQWERTLRGIALGLVDELVERVPYSAIHGRNTGMTFMSAGRAEAIFRADLNKALSALEEMRKENSHDRR